MLTLYHSPQSRSSRIIWLLEEIGAPYEIVYVGIKRGDGSGMSDPQNVHPDKKVPALMHDGSLLAESGAICLYLTDMFAAANLGFKHGESQRASYLTWLFFYASEAEPGLMHKMLGMAEKEPRLAAQFDQVVQRLQAALQQGPYIMGERFTAVDVLFGSMVQWARKSLPDDPLIDAYSKRLYDRPAAQQAFAKDSPPET